MSEIQPAQRSVMSVVGEGFSVAKQTFGSVGPIYLVFIVVYLVSSGYQSFLTAPVNAHHFDGVSVLLHILVSIVYVWAVIGAMAAASGQVKGQPLSTGHLASLGVRRLIPLFLAFLLTGIILFVGFILLVVPFLYLSVRLYLTTFMVAAEHNGPIEGINKGADLVKGNWWHTCGVVAVATLIPLLVYLLVLLLTFFGNGGQAALHGASTDFHPTISPMVKFLGQIGVLVVEIFGMQLSAGIAAALTADLRARHSEEQDTATAMQA